MNSLVFKPSVGLVEPASCSLSAISTKFQIIKITTDDLRVDFLRKRGIRLIIFEGKPASLIPILGGLRSSAPDIAIFALTDGLDLDNGVFCQNYVDGVFSMPAESAQLGASIDRELGSFSNNHLDIFWRVAKNGVIIPASFLLLWWIFVILFKPAPYLLPSPVNVLYAFGINWASFVSHLLVTAYEAFLGFLIGNGAGIVIAVFLHRYTSLQGFTMPVLISFQAIPVVALAPLLAVWLGTGLLSKIAMATIICFFPMVINALNAFSNIDRDYIELFEFYRARYPSKLRMLLLPAAFPALVAALKISAGLAVVGAIVAELTGADRGLGYLLLNASYRLETDIMFVAMLLSGFLGIIFFNMPVLLNYVIPRSWRSASL